jgi:hypothetical protein
MKIKATLWIIFCAALGFRAGAQTPVMSDSEPAVMLASISLSPAIIMVRCSPGQSTTQVLTIANHTANQMDFNLATEDVVVREGKRFYWPAGHVANGIAARTVMLPAVVVLRAGEEASVQVTFTIPPGTGQRAVVTYFHGVVSTGNGAVGLTASLGTLITFNVSNDYRLEIGSEQASVQTPAANLILSEEVRNSGSEPVTPKGVLVILNAAGKRVAKAAFSPQRILPGEQLIFSATNPIQLAPGDYHTLSSLEFEGKVMTSAGQFTIPE